MKSSKEIETCPECLGDGYLIATVHDGRGGDADEEVTCRACGGTGEADGEAGDHFDDRTEEERQTNRLPSTDDSGPREAYL